MKTATSIIALLSLVACAGSGGSGSEPIMPSPPLPPSTESVLNVDFEDLSGTSAFVIETQFVAPDSVPGVTGQAWRTDGFSSFGRGAIDLSGAEGFTVSTWVALESYPSDREVPVRDLSPSSIVNQRRSGDGFDIFIDTYGRWGVWVSTNRGRVTVEAPTNFPLYRWNHVAAKLDPAGREVALFLDGEKIASESLSANTVFRPADTELLVARPVDEVDFLVFTLNRLNGAYDNLSVTSAVQSDSEIRSDYQRFASSLPDWTVSLVVPESRFAADYQRPRVHGIPPSGWANESHGLTLLDGTWHMFYQRTPNGPFKTQMHWGHLVSDDLVTWRTVEDALRPELQTDTFGFDQKGIWSGDVIVDGGKAFAFYTSVNHSDRLDASNPGVAMAVSEDPDLLNWEKMGPIINTRFVNDFRDPYLFRSGGTWHMIIGAALSSGGGLDYWVLEPGESGGRWDHRNNFVSPRYGDMDIGSIIWEMPVFEPLDDKTWILTVAPIGGEVSKYGTKATRNVYWMGTWNGSQFTPYSTEPKPLDIIPGHIAPTVDRGADGRIRAIGIVDERRTPQSQEDAGWAQTFSLPKVWSLMPDGRTLGQAPAPEAKALRGANRTVSTGQTLEDGKIGIDNDLHAYELEIDLAPIASGSIVGVELLALDGGSEVTRFEIDTNTGRVTVDKSESTLDAQEQEGPQVISGSYDAAAFGAVETIRVFVDGSVVEVFINDAATFSFRSYPSRADATNAAVFANGDPISVERVTFWPLRLPG